ncbi:MAG: DNA topoisomerase IV subunit B, partial [Candidatus Krumholzibacteria bacterium]|nr:DNA topoisomerase IV subunit B [Candidatus Krumholzibacteria bacterium]
MSKEYTAKGIQVLKGLEAVRKRPAMYIGSTDIHGLHHMIYEVIDNSIDEAMAGHCSKIEIVISKDGYVTVTDDGRGIPVDMHPTQKKPAVEVVMTTLHAGGKFDHDSYKVSGGLHGVGVSCTNALSEWLEVEICRDGHKYFQRYERGLPTGKMKKTGKSRKHGTRMTFKPDPEVFEETVFDFDRIAKRLLELSFLAGGVRITLRDEREGQQREDVFFHKGGVSAYVEYLNEGKNTLHKPIHFVTAEDGVESEVAIQYTDSVYNNLVSYANAIHTTEGGTHMSGFKTAVTRVTNNYAFSTGLRKEKERNFSGDEVREGMTAVISVKLMRPQFEGQTK